jgi:hypothetical protein
MSPKSFDQFIEAAGIKPTLRTWLATQAGLKAELDRLILKGASPTLLYDWLVSEYEYPLGRTSVIRYATVLKAAA